MTDHGHAKVGLMRIQEIIEMVKMKRCVKNITSIKDSFLLTATVRHPMEALEVRTESVVIVSHVSSTFRLL